MAHLEEILRYAEAAPTAEYSLFLPDGPDGIPGPSEHPEWSVVLFEFLTGFESAVVISRRFPRDALCPGNMATADRALLRILTHMRYLAFEFAGRTHIN